MGSRRLHILSTGERYRTGIKVGGLWEELGQLQFDFLVAQGLAPHHRLLDVGCGSLRAGVLLIPYLKDGHYFGVDKSSLLITAAREVELPRYGLADHTVHLEVREDFEFTGVGVDFEFVLAQSVFTHLPWNSILRCLHGVSRVLTERGRFFATFFEDPRPRYYPSSLTHDRAGVVTYPDSNPYHYPFDVFEELARRTGLEVTRLGDWGHPRDQKMLCFEPAGT